MNTVAYSAIVRGEIQRILRIWRQTLLPPLVSAALFFIVFGGVIGSRLGLTQGFTYLEFITPGLIMMALITASYTNAVASFFSAKYQKSIEEFLIAPVSNATVVLGFVSGAMFRGLLVSLLVTILARFFAPFHVLHPAFLVLMAVLTSSCFALGGMINALFAKKFDDISTLSDFILTPLIYFAGVFYSIDRLPGSLKVISSFNPLLYIMNGFRFGFLGIGPSSIIQTLSVLIGLNIALFVLNIFLLKRRVGLNF